MGNVSCYNVDQLILDQHDCPEISKVLEILEGENVDTSEIDYVTDWYLSNAFLYDGVLVIDPEPESHDFQVIVPVKLRRLILEHVHGSQISGHLGVKKTMGKLHKLF